MSTEAPGSWLIANARIAPTAIRIRLTGMPTSPLCPLCVKEERPRHAGVVATPAVAAGRVLLERAHREAAPCRRRHDLPDSPRVRVEVALTPVHEPVDDERNGMLLVEEQVAAVPQRSGNSAQPGLEITNCAERAEAGIDEVEAAAAELARQRLRVGLHPEDRRPALPRGLEGGAGGVDAGDDAAELRELRGRLAGAALEVEHALLLQVGERS